MENNLPSASSSGSPLRWIAFIVIVLVLGGAGFAAVRNSPNPDNQNQNQAQNPSPSVTVGAPLSPHTLVYGSWVGNGSEITAVDLSTRRSATLALLPIKIKKVTILSPLSLLYIDETNTRDHGKSLKVYDFKRKIVTATIPSDTGFGIDDYMISPNKKFVAIWEVSFAEGSQVLQGGRSRVYAVNLDNPSVKKLIYDDTAGANTPVHYPRAILDDGKIFTDKFLPSDPNGGAGWAYGMSVANFDGSAKTDLPQMAHGTYGTQPVLSADGKSLLFAGYDGGNGPGTAIKNGFRQAILTPNTVEVLDTATLNRRELQNLSSANTYTSVNWGQSASKAILSVISESPDQSGLFTYNLATNTATAIKLPDSEQANYSYISQLTNDNLLIATIETSPSSIGNLGEGYSSLINQLYIFEPVANQASSLRFNGLVQHISVLPQNYFRRVLGIAHAQGGNPREPNVTIIDLYSDKPAEKNLQLKTFLMKPELAPVREEQQTEPPQPTPPPPGITAPPPPPKQEGLPRCRDLLTQQCADRNSKDPRCAQLFSGNKDAVCYDSPLYLYGKSGDKVSVKIQTQVYNDTPTYSNGYNITLQENGKMQINGRVYSAINYDYRSNLKMLRPPTKGAFVARSGVERTLREYAGRLGLNEKETADLVRVGKTKVTSPYVFISFFDHETSSSILPLSFIPKPDNYLNIVFYFKLLDKKPDYTPVPPTFGKPIERTGLTAIEVSEIVE